MTSSSIRGRPRHAKSHIAVRVAHALLGCVVGVVWLVLPGMTIRAEEPVPVAGVTAAAEQGGTSPADLVLPLVVVAAAVVLAAYGYLRRTRRARSRTTPGLVSAHPPEPSARDFERQARASLVAADDSVRTSREELGFAEARFGPEAVDAVEPFAAALRAAETELAAAFAIRRRYEQGVPEDQTARRQALVGIVGRCAEAGRRLDTEAAGFDQLRSLEGGMDEALGVAEGRFRALAGRTKGAGAVPAELGERYAPSAAAPVTGYVEQAKDRLVFATTHLNRARQLADSGEGERAARELRAAEGAVAQAEVLVSGVERLAAELAEAAGLVPAVLTGGEAEVAEARRRPRLLPEGELRARLAHADAALAAVREELIRGPYDPLDALRRITRAVGLLGVGRAGVVPVAGLLAARSATSAAGDFIATHRAAVGAEARTRLAEAERLLAAEAGEYAVADGLAREARELAERDVRAHGNPYDGAADRASGLAGAVLGGILLGEEPDGGPPASFGGPDTRDRRRLPRE
ncbi:hypothetical protein ABZ864_02390 [Streptomyces sp. NPDC047082]|uniref:hypothetical protein n=1 Tax=Streptomyces sp. NPDC047082 TaxID=3155259 RepID=UPI0033F04FA0